ncbi:MAG: aminopeptidase [bacterium]|nr:aminopeptidase [bacterium]
MENILEKYADVIVNYCLKLKKGEKVFLRGTHLAEPFMKEIYKKALQAGAFVHFEIELNGQQKIFYEYASDELLKTVSPVRKYLFQNFDALASILSPFNVKELQNVSAEKKKIVNIANTEINKLYMQRSFEGKLKWVVCQYPCDAAAQESEMSLSEYEEIVYGACYLFDKDPVAKWREVHDMQQKIVDFLNGKKNVRYKGNDIDIEFSTDGRVWLNSDGTHNMPSGEVFTSPVEDSVNGHIRFSYPGIFMGQEIEDISLEVEKGLIVSWDAKKGKDFLDQLFQIPGSTRFGEAAIGTNYGIKKFTKNILFDEKLGGTIHMAVGASYQETGGKNDCSVHLDFIADMKTNSEITADGKLLYKDGKFVI